MPYIEYIVEGLNKTKQSYLIDTSAKSKNIH